MSALDSEDSLKGDDKIIREAKRRFKYCEDWEAEARNRFLDDLKFANGDADNKYQWPDAIRASRDQSERPCLTINKTRQHNLHIINDAKQNTPQIKIVAVGEGASFQSSQIYEGVVRHIEYISNASVAYDTATEFQVEAGIGYWRVVTDYAGDDSFDQEIYIRRIKDPLNVYIDPDINEKDGSDARFAFVFDDMTKEEFKEAYPKYKDKMSQAPLGDTTAWSDEHHVRVAEYFRCVEKEDRLISMTDPMTGQQVQHRMSKMPDELKAFAKQVVDDPSSKYRTIVDNVVEHYLIIGNEIIEKTIWPGRYIPIVRVIGEETVIDGQLDRKGHTRALLDQQRMYNYSASASVEFIALQSKSPFIAPVDAIEGLEVYWNNLNTENHAILPFNHRDDQGNDIPMPQRAEPPAASSGFVQMMQDSAQQMDMASGQYEATFGQQSNERSGVAISARQRQGETATYHYIDNLAIGIRFTGKILIDLIPKIYDTPRILNILAEDGTSTEVEINPEIQQAHMQLRMRNTNEVKNIFNPNVGKYDVEADVAPGYATKREEAFNALSQIIQSDPQAFMLLGDLWAENADFPTSDKIAERMRNMLPPQARGEQGPNPQMQQMEAQMQQMGKVNEKLLQQLAEMKLKEKGVAAQKDIDAFNAETNRLKVNADALSKHVLTPRDQIMLQHEFAMQEHAGDLQREVAELNKANAGNAE